LLYSYQLVLHAWYTRPPTHYKVLRYNVTWSYSSDLSLSKGADLYLPSLQKWTPREGPTEPSWRMGGLTNSLFSCILHLLCCRPNFRMFIFVLALSWNKQCIYIHLLLPPGAFYFDHDFMLWKWMHKCICYLFKVGAPHRHRSSYRYHFRRK